MNTYLPYDDLRLSAAVLRPAELRIQIQDCLKMLDALHERDSGLWINEPIVQAWKGCELQLSEFGLLCFERYIKDKPESKTDVGLYARLSQHQDWAHSGDSNMALPRWFGKAMVHDQYKELLIGLDPAYAPIFPGFGPRRPEDFIFFFDDRPF